MNADLFQLIGKFRNIENLETPQAFYMTKVPAVAPEAYLNIIFKAVPSNLILELSKQLRFPESLFDFYRKYNGAHLFVNVLSIYGCVPKGTPIDRSDKLSLQPFDIRDVNDELDLKLASTNFVCFASYGFDQSLVCIDRDTEEIICYEGENLSKERMRWPSINEWLSSELQRISLFFDEEGNRLIEEEWLLPSSVRIH